MCISNKLFSSAWSFQWYFIDMMVELFVRYKQITQVCLLARCCCQFLSHQTYTIHLAHSKKEISFRKGKNKQKIEFQKGRCVSINPNLKDYPSYLISALYSQLILSHSDPFHKNTKDGRESDKFVSPKRCLGGGISTSWCSATWLPSIWYI